MLIRLRILRSTPEVATEVENTEPPGTTEIDYDLVWKLLIKSLTGITLIFLLIFVLAWVFFNCWQYLHRDNGWESRCIFSWYPSLQGSDSSSLNSSQSDDRDVEKGVPKFMAKRAVIMHTKIEICNNPTGCGKIINEVKKKGKDPLSFNFLIAPNGFLYEVLGWESLSSMYPELSAITIGIMGSMRFGPNFTQLHKLNSLLKEAVQLGYLQPSFTIVGKVEKECETPAKLFRTLRQRPEFDLELSDRY